MKKNLLSAFAVLAMSFVAFSSGSSNDAASTEQSTENEKKENWTYAEQEDKMDAKKQYFASTTSTNEIDFKVPYSGGSTMDIELRDLGEGDEALLKISKGQFMPSLMADKTIKVKFDDKASKTFVYASPTDLSANVIFIKEAKSFIKQLKESKTVMIEPTFFNEGNVIFEYKTEGLKWGK